MFYGNPEALPLSKLLCEKHLRNVCAGGYPKLTKEQMRSLVKPFNQWQAELKKKQVMASGDRELIKLLKG